jgi:ribosomal protein S18 acetylase RimI-like enzyme
MIRNLTTNDFDEYYRVRLNSLTLYPVAYSSMPKFFIEATSEMHLKVLADSESESSFFIKGFFQDNKLIGIIGILPETRESVDHKASMWGFYVDPEFQGLGIGRKLLDQFLIDARNDLRLRSVRLVAATNCESALSLFHKVGFEQYGLERESIRDNEKFYDQIYMQMNVSN